MNSEQSSKLSAFSEKLICAFATEIMFKLFALCICSKKVMFVNSLSSGGRLLMNSFKLMTFEYYHCLSV